MIKINDNLQKNVSEQLKILIKAKYKTIELFCYENDISKGTMSDILSNKKLPRLNTLKRITSSLNIQLSDFFKKIKE